MTARGVVIRLVVAALVAGLLVAVAWQTRTEVRESAVVDVPTTVTHWRPPYPEPPPPTAPYPGAWCGYECRNGRYIR